MFSDTRGLVRCLNHLQDLADHDSDTESEQKDANLAIITNVEDIIIASSADVVRICLLALTMHTYCKLPTV